MLGNKLLGVLLVGLVLCVSCSRSNSSQQSTLPDNVQSVADADAPIQNAPLIARIARLQNEVQALQKDGGIKKFSLPIWLELGKITPHFFRMIFLAAKNSPPTQVERDAVQSFNQRTQAEAAAWVPYADDEEIPNAAGSVAQTSNAEDVNTQIAGLSKFLSDLMTLANQVDLYSSYSGLPSSQYRLLNIRAGNLLNLAKRIASRKLPSGQNAAEFEKNERFGLCFETGVAVSEDALALEAVKTSSNPAISNLFAFEDAAKALGDLSSLCQGDTLDLTSFVLRAKVTADKYERLSREKMP